MADGYADATYLSLVVKSKGNAGHFGFLITFGARMGELREARIPMRPAIGVLLKPTGYIFTAFSMIVQGFAEATTDTICDFDCFNKTSKL